MYFYKIHAGLNKKKCIHVIAVFMKEISLNKVKNKKKSCTSQQIYSFLKISKNIGTAHLDRCIKQFRYFRTAIITSYVISDWIKLLKVGRIL